MQLHALYCLIYFYYSTKTVLAPINPVGKFMAIKMIVFFTFWQACVRVRARVCTRVCADSSKLGLAVCVFLRTYVPSSLRVLVCSRVLVCVCAYRFFPFWQNLGLSVLQSQGWLPWIDL